MKRKEYLERKEEKMDYYVCIRETDSGI